MKPKNHFLRAETEKSICVVCRPGLSAVTLICLQLVLVGHTWEVTTGLLCPESHPRLDNSSSSIINTSLSPSSMTPLDINIGLFISVSNKGSGKLYGGAFFLAIDVLNEKAAKDKIPVRFRWTFRDTANKETCALKEVVDLHCSQKVSALIGPEIFCKSSALLATAFGIPYITFNCQDSHNETGNLLVVNTETSVVYISRFITSVLQHYQWRSFWLVTGLTNKWQNMVRLLRASGSVKNISINGETGTGANDEFNSYYFNSNPYRNIIETSRHRTRVYVFLGVYESVLMFLRELSLQGMTSSGEYVVVTADDSKDNRSEATFYLTTLESKKNLTSQDRQSSLSAFRNVLIVRTLDSEVYQQNFEDAVFNRSVLPPLHLSPPPRKMKRILDCNHGTVGSVLIRSSLHSIRRRRPNIPSQAYQLYDATLHYGKAVMALMFTPGADPENGSQIIDYIRCKSHDSIQGNRIFIHPNGESEGSYKVESLLSDPDKRVEPRLRVVGTFISSSGLEPVYKPTRPVVWVGGHPPVSNPRCGFDGKSCPINHLPVWKVASIIVGAFVFVLFAVVILILGLRNHMMQMRKAGNLTSDTKWCTLLLHEVKRHYMYEQKLERLAWKIEREDIQILNDKQLATPSRTRKKDSFCNNQLRSLILDQDSDTDVISNGSNTSADIPLGVYKGTSVAVRKLTRKHLELTRALKKQLQLRKELTHENINRFIGACIETPNLYMVTQFCPRKSLQDILRSENSTLDDMFVTSLVQDLIKGMTFIHDSELGFHGNLKSTNCLVDSRWTLKISDFGLSALGFSDTNILDDEETCRGLLWTAPELLRCRRPSQHSNSHHQNLYSDLYRNNNNNIINNTNTNHNINKYQVTGSQNGDVYSFAVILYELYGKSGPWGHTKMTNRQIIEVLLSRTTPVLRPDTSTLTCDPHVLNLITACWEDDPELRPDFKYEIRHRFKPIQQGFLKSNIFDNMLAMMEKHANNLEVVVAERTEQLRLEKKMTENLLLRMLPRSVAEKLKRGQLVEAEQFEQVSIYFSDIVGFTELSAESTPMEVVDLLNDLYTCFDSIIEGFDVYKVETIGDAYMVVSGLPIRNGDRHAGEIASMSLLLLEAIRKTEFRIHGNSNNFLRIRIGIHSGPCCAGVVGLKMPRYCLFGDTVNTASRLESTGEALKIHCSAECKNVLDKLGGYTLQERGLTEMKGKGSLLTYFLVSEDQDQRYRRIHSYKKMGNDGRCVSASNLDYSGKIYSFGVKGHSNLPNGGDHNLTRDTITTSRNSFSGLNNTTDSAWSDDSLRSHSPTRSAPSPLSHDLLSSTLPRSSCHKFNHPQMSPIAEDPFSDRTLETPTSFYQAQYHLNAALEQDALLGGAPGYHLNISDRPSGKAHKIKSQFIRSPGTDDRKMETFNEDSDDIDDENKDYIGDDGSHKTDDRKQQTNLSSTHSSETVL